ncbi:PREDICTED: uncharacterized protein LOC106105723 [Papilio polytes]|uniref:uncharacterized protein LOC106105723 n=1 Tax=Papilio polytes TaxID=76194 RepID=UPI000676A916|nr:PREDICTED: uncharacterized protein LOC106105723 [Papilio polytes]XP_013141607.1 PREDICTED: uncharacterized protein LOC106105723 [Papilio polytes]
MGCGSSGQVISSQDTDKNGEAKSNGKQVNGHHDNDLPTVVLPDTPVKPKPPVAYEIPLEEFSGGRPMASPPPHLQRLLQPPSADITLPRIEEKLAEAEQRRLTILQQRAASAQKRIQKTIRSPDNGNFGILQNTEGKHTSNPLPIPPEPGVCEDRIM